MDIAERNEECLEMESKNLNLPSHSVHASKNGILRSKENFKTSNVSFSNLSDGENDDEDEENSRDRRQRTRVSSSKNETFLLSLADFLLNIRSKLSEFFKNHIDLIKYLCFVCIFIALNVYMVFVIIVSPSKAVFLVPAFYVILCFVTWRKLKKWGAIDRIKECSSIDFDFDKFHDQHFKAFGYLSLVKKIVLLMLWAIITFIFGKSCWKNYMSLLPTTGLLLLVTLSFICSKRPHLVKISTVFWGLAIQILVAYSITRTESGHYAFQTTSSWAKSFFDFSSYGSKFIFGPLHDGALGQTAESYFVFAIHSLPLIIFLNSVVSVLYFFGIMQVAIKSIAYLLKVSLGTSVPETLSAAANIFLGQVESPLIISPYLSKLSLSELHAVMCGGFATVAASVLGAYLKMPGLNPTHVVAASVLNAPASLVFAKIVLPEDPREYHRSIEQVNFSQSKEKNVIEAAANGACEAMPICLNMSASIIAFLSILAFLNFSLSFFGGLVGYPMFDLEDILAYILYPAALLMGLTGRDAFMVAALMGKKVIVNEFVALDSLSSYVQQGLISEKTQAIAIYAVCNFANIGSLGIQLGGLGAIMPDRKHDLVKVGWSALICGGIASISNACIISILFENTTDENFIPQNSTNVWV